ncbi:hypothetical protein PHYSODRAFT_485321 [Phytophthora sojae]|uniref:DUF4461 domain-containing protein n=1 Tax=Phytophthora sojae (strain P6497) TaxID=1094619 RepID=G4Z057_PHYSP|nr:hypothetical protein PHYSODRAFT_485321 [Phytophthora sojae]EGZ23996.1 hypothetical protein PHYSODRAFT_485321 [Phytophthora sojae]|eukprot:XP_009519284.1 hypothetical protein PHYSODRAFT_485321 [Phytophthora sojae]
MAKRSTTLKQFLLRVHPDHFRNNPKVHDENLQSVKLLNQFMDEHYAAQGGAGSMSWRRLGAPREKRLKRFALELAANIETKMVAVLKECGGGRRRPSGMDFGDFTMGEMYAKANRAAVASASRRRKKPIQTLQGLLEFMKEEETMEAQQRQRIAWESIQSAKNTLKRELDLQDVLFSCGWSTMHLNTTVMILLQTLRKYSRANKQGIFTPKDFLRGATIDLSANPSGIDLSNEYRIVLNPADVPVQWVQVLETIDANMVVFMKAAQESLATLQADATAALGEANISRGHTCSALGYRTFLQSMRQRDAAGQSSEQGLLEKFALVIEDDSYEWVVLETGEVRAPFTSSYGEAISFLSTNRSLIRRQQETHNANLEAFAYISSRCADAMHVKAITRDEGIPVGMAVVACEELLKAVVGMTPPSSRSSIPQGMVRFLDTYTQGRSICISRTYGLGQDGVFTLPADWFKW